MASLLSDSLSTDVGGDAGYPREEVAQHAFLALFLLEPRQAVGFLVNHIGAGRAAVGEKEEKWLLENLRRVSNGHSRSDSAMSWAAWWESEQAHFLPSEQCLDRIRGSFFPSHGDTFDTLVAGDWDFVPGQGGEVASPD